MMKKQTLLEKKEIRKMSLVNYISTKGKMKRGEMNVNVCQNSWEIRLSGRWFSKEEPVRVVESPN